MCGGRCTARGGGGGGEGGGGEDARGVAEESHVVDPAVGEGEWGR